jgi:hypothetical protein
MTEAKSLFVYSISLLFLVLSSGSSRAAAQPPFTLKLSYTTVYNDNILKYSVRDLDRFENNTEVYPSEIATTDDWVNTFGLRLYRDLDLGRRWKLRPYYSFRISLYAINRQKNLTSHLFLARLSHRYRYYFYLQYSYTPGYYLRIYQDRDLSQYYPCDFDAYRQTARFRWRLNPAELEARWGREFLYYNDHFTEYDSEAFFWGLNASYRLPIRVKFSAGYEFKASDNIGFASSPVTTGTSPLEDTEYGDSSYEEDRYRLRLDCPLKTTVSRTYKFTFEYEHRLRYYQSDQPVEDDPFHTGRKDRRRIFVTTLSLDLQTKIGFKAVFTYDQRRTDSPVTTVSEIKNYDNRIFELVVTYQVF